MNHGYRLLSNLIKYRLTPQRIRVTWLFRLICLSCMEQKSSLILSFVLWDRLSVSHTMVYKAVAFVGVPEDMFPSRLDGKCYLFSWSSCKSWQTQKGTFFKKPEIEFPNSSFQLTEVGMHFRFKRWIKKNNFIQGGGVAKRQCSLYLLICLGSNSNVSDHGKIWINDSSPMRCWQWTVQ